MMSNFDALRAGYIDTIDVIIIEHIATNIIEYKFSSDGIYLKNKFLLEIK